MDFKINYNPDAYEFWGYLVPGFLVLGLLWRFFGNGTLNFERPVIITAGFFVVLLFMAYVTGLFLHWISTNFFRRFREVTYPVSDGRDDKDYGIPFAKKLLDAVVSYYKLNGQRDNLLPQGAYPARCLYELCYHSEYVLGNPLRSVYLARATMFRNLTLAFGLTALLYFLSLLSVEFTSAPFVFFKGERCLGLFLSFLFASAFCQEADRVTKVLYRTVFITWWERYGRNENDPYNPE